MKSTNLANILKLITTAISAPSADEKIVPSFQPVINAIADSKTVALGDQTHGTRDFYLMKQCMIKNLIEKKGFTLLCIERGDKEVGIINEFIHGEGDESQLKDKMRAALGWMWFTDEVLNLLVWIKEFNKTAKHKISFHGFDIPDTDKGDQEKISNRHKIMAENLRAIRLANPNEKMIIWAHNYHISKDCDMGELVAKLPQFSDYCAIGFASFSGTFTGFLNDGKFTLARNNKLLAASENSLEYDLHNLASGSQQLFVDFRKLQYDYQYNLRNTTANVAFQFFRPYKKSDFDGMIYFENTEATKEVSQDALSLISSKLSSNK